MGFNGAKMAEGIEEAVVISQERDGGAGTRGGGGMGSGQTMDSSESRAILIADGLDWGKGGGGKERKEG